MVRKRTKKLRGGHYGRGMKAGRGKGKKGGNGMAGLGKHHWIWMVKYDPLHYGGKGFTSHHFKKPDVAISLTELEGMIPSLREKGYVKDGENRHTEADGGHAHQIEAYKDKPHGAAS